jgi:hypothetical protein
MGCAAGEKHKQIERWRPADNGPRRRRKVRSQLGELGSSALPNAGDIPTSAFWESARPGVAIAATPSVRSGPDAWNHAIGTVRALALYRLPPRSPTSASNDSTASAVLAHDTAPDLVAGLIGSFLGDS